MVQGRWAMVMYKIVFCKPCDPTPACAWPYKSLPCWYTNVQPNIPLTIHPSAFYVWQVSYVRSIQMVTMSLSGFHTLLCSCTRNPYPLGTHVDKVTIWFPIACKHLAWVCTDRQAIPMEKTIYVPLDPTLCVFWTKYSGVIGLLCAVVELSPQLSWHGFPPSR